ncbi:mannose-ethanolamine phosphotransferase GPI11 [Sporobolomyces salmoneus]|uniref:mannose-ethanolamine phosphotransferase GPI11 n=1 Tax=Sporobolomyces salmoneus TaxID=183962 RepID=UPI0031784B38
MARGKKAVHPSTQPKPTEAPSTTPKAVQTTKKLPSPLPFAHYLPRIPLQLAASYFCLLASSSSTTTDLAGNRFNPTARILNSIIHEPLRTLPIACASLALVQTWFGIWAKGCRTKAIKLAENGGKIKEKPKPKRQKLQIKDVFGDMWTRAKRGELPHKTLIMRAREPGVDGKAAINTDFLVPAIATTLAGAVALHVCAVLLGASLISNIRETALLSLPVSILAVLPLAIAVPPILAPTSGTDRYVWLRFFSSVSPNDDLELALLAPALGTIIGCWLGAVPIPLDWDRPWQVWPTTCLVGALLGHAAGSVVSLGICAFHAAARAAQESLDQIKEE